MFIYHDLPKIEGITTEQISAVIARGMCMESIVRAFNEIASIYNDGYYNYMKTGNSTQLYRTYVSLKDKLNGLASSLKEDILQAPDEYDDYGYGYQNCLRDICDYLTMVVQRRSSDVNNVATTDVTTGIISPTNPTETYDCNKCSRTC